MSVMKILSPVVEKYGITVSIPMSEPFGFTTKLTIYEAENLFVQKRDNASMHAVKVEFDRARALLKYAGTYGANLEQIYCEKQKLKVTVSFCRLEELVEFKETMSRAVSGAIMS